MRAQGYSFNKIARELGKSKQTLIDWSKELQEEVANLKALELEALYEKFHLLREGRIQNLGMVLSKLRKEVEERDFSNVPTDRLLDLLLKYTNVLKDEMVDPVFNSAEEVREERLVRELLSELTIIGKNQK